MQEYILESLKRMFGNNYTKYKNITTDRIIESER